MAPNSTYTNTKLVDTPSGTPNTPSDVSQNCEAARDSEAPLCAIKSGANGPANT